MEYHTLHTPSIFQYTPSTRKHKSRQKLFTPSLFFLEIRLLLGETNFALGPNPELFLLFFDTVILLHIPSLPPPCFIYVCSRLQAPSAKRTNENSKGKIRRNERKKSWKWKWLKKNGRVVHLMQVVPMSRSNGGETADIFHHKSHWLSVWTHTSTSEKYSLQDLTNARWGVALPIIRLFWLHFYSSIPTTDRKTFSPLIYDFPDILLWFR